MSKTLERIEQYTREQLVRLLKHCTEEENQFFKNLYKSVEAIPAKKLPTAIKQVERTLIINGKEAAITEASA